MNTDSGSSASLTEYLRGPYQRHKEELSRITSLINEVVPLFAIASSERAWPYSIDVGENIKPLGHYSMSTNAMILFTISMLLGKLKESVLMPEVLFDYSQPDASDNLKPTFESNRTRLIEEIKNSTFKTTSKTYGENDPFTITWILELLRGSDDSEVKKIVQTISETAKKRLNEIRVGNLPTILRWHGGDYNNVDHAFPILRFVQLLRSSSIVDTTEKTAYEALKKALYENLYGELLNRLHQHLSFAGMSGTMLDIAEMVFCMEGVILLDEVKSFDVDLVSSVFRTVGKHQVTGHWLMSKPFIATTTGLELTPLSVEVANSLLRICAVCHRNDKRSFFSENASVFERFADWIVSRLMRGHFDSKSVAGWNTKDSYNGKRLYLWESAHVLLFLLGYKSHLQEHLARTELAVSNLAVSPPTRPLRERLNPAPYWAGVSSEYEPLSGFDVLERFTVYSHIGEEYINCRDSGHSSFRRPKSYSMLLYGPPGTGKTSIAREIANSLRWPLVTITPSDLIAEGEAQIEARTKAIFKILEDQKDVVILFDEIDRLILDRDSLQYTQQGDLFQFMTPSMLVKLNDLRGKSQSVFIISTNYEDKIDLAAKRFGRIDSKFLVLPPSFTVRKAILKKQFLKQINAIWPKTTLTPELESKIEKIARNVPLANFGELKNFVRKTVLARSPTTAATDALATMTKSLNAEQPNLNPAIRLSSYQNRFRSEKSHEFPATQEPFIEFFLLLMLKVETADPDLDKPILPAETALVKHVFNRVGALVDPLKMDSQDTQKQSFKQLFGEFGESVGGEIFEKLYPFVRA